MRTDHIAFQRAARVAAIGLALQILMGLAVLIFGFVSRDSTSQIAGLYVLTGCLVWIGLWVVFHQHKLERLEALETDELRASRMAGGSMFDAEAAESDVAGRRLRLMHKYLMPLISLVVMLLLGAQAAFWLWRLGLQDAINEESAFAFRVTREPGLAVAICLAFALVSFIFSRFVAGMAKQPAWQNLRGGAGYMVGNALVLLTVGVGVSFAIFNNAAVIEWVAHAIPIFMIIVAAEILLNWILNLYRPRRVGEAPRPAFDSRVLSLLSAPDSIVRSINEAVNYQFGFDITSSWGYQLLLRTFNWLILFAVAVLVFLNCMVVVEPHQQAIRLRGGSLVGDVHRSGVMWKLPWPIEQAEIFDVGRVHELALTPRVIDRGGAVKAHLWAEQLDTNLGIEPFIVSTRSTLTGDELRQRQFDRLAGDEAGPTGEGGSADAPEEVDRISDEFALVEAEFVLQYRIREDPEEGLKKYLAFSSDLIERRQRNTMRERGLKAIALREVSQYCSSIDLDEVIAHGRSDMVRALEDRIQAAFDAHDTGVEVLTLSLPWIRPAGTAARSFEEFAFNVEGRKQRVAQARSTQVRQLTSTAGSVNNAERLVQEIEAYESLRQGGTDEAAIEAKRLSIEEMLARSGGEAARIIAEARSARWRIPLQEKARAQRFLGRLNAYRAGPDVYREYLTMDSLGYALADARKYFIGVPPELVRINIKMLPEDELFNFAETGSTTGEEQSQ